MIRLSIAMVLLMSVSAISAPASADWGSSETFSKSDPMSDVVALIKDKKFSEALPLLSSLAKEQPGNANVFNLLGYTKRKLGKLEQSGLDYARALRLDPHHRGALEYQGELFLRLGNVAKAERNLARLKKVCISECEEAEELAEAIAAWREQQSN